MPDNAVADEPCNDDGRRGGRDEYLVDDAREELRKEEGRRYLHVGVGDNREHHEPRYDEEDIRHAIELADA